MHERASERLAGAGHTNELLRRVSHLYLHLVQSPSLAHPSASYSIAWTGKGNPRDGDPPLSAIIVCSPRSKIQPCTYLDVPSLSMHSRSLAHRANPAAEMPFLLPVPPRGEVHPDPGLPIVVGGARVKLTSEQSRGKLVRLHPVKISGRLVDDNIRLNLYTISGKDIPHAQHWVSRTSAHLFMREMRAFAGAAVHELPHYANRHPALRTSASLPRASMLHA